MALTSLRERVVLLKVDDLSWGTVSAARPFATAKPAARVISAAGTARKATRRTVSPLLRWSAWSQKANAVARSRSAAMMTASRTLTGPGRQAAQATRAAGRINIRAGDH